MLCATYDSGPIVLFTFLPLIELQHNVIITTLDDVAVLKKKQ